MNDRLRLTFPAAMIKTKTLKAALRPALRRLLNYLKTTTCVFLIKQLIVFHLPSNNGLI